MTQGFAGSLTTAGRTMVASASPRRAARRVYLRSLSLAAAVLLSAACSDAPTAPDPIDRAAVARVMPSVVDARTRLAPSIENSTVRERVIFDIQELENALN